MERCVRDFIFFCLHDDAKPMPSFRSIDWNLLYQFGEKQSILGVLFHGIERLHGSDVSIPQDVFFRWMSVSMSIKKSNIRVYASNALVTACLDGRYGHRGCTLKGQGNALMYPSPYIRMSGDIDLWCLPNDGERVDDVIRLCRKMSPTCGINYHHADMGDIKGTHVELHFRPSFIENLFYNNRLQHYFRSNLDKQRDNVVELPDGLGRIYVPTAEFNLIFQLSHIQRHFFFEGIGMRHLMDYYYLLRHGYSEEQQKSYVRTLRSLNMYKFARGVMYVMREWFGLEEQYLLLKPSRRIGEFIMAEVLATGNFGFHDTRFSRLKSSNRVTSAFYSILKELRFIVEFPGETFFGHAVWILWWHFYYSKKIEKTASKL